MMTEITLRLEKIGVIPVIAIEHINHARSQPVIGTAFATGR
jgi:hypothetical protein